MKLPILILILMISINLNAQTDETTIKQTINLFFEGMENNDTAKIKTTIDIDGCLLKSIMKKKDGTTLLQSENMTEFYKQVQDAKDLKIKEELLSYDIKIDGQLAIAWTPYRFTIDGKLTHCGVDVFTLIKRSNVWSIIAITDTRRKQGCE
jgi:hypothetical protein